MSQVDHICPLPGNHQASLDYLSDEQILPILLAMDSETLLALGRTSSRFYVLVCDRQVWGHLLRNVDEFTKEKVEELVVFGDGLFGMEGRPGMISEILKEAVGEFIYLTGPMKLTIETQCLGSRETFSLDAHFFEDLKAVTYAVRTTFSITEMTMVHWDQDSSLSPALITLIASIFSHISRQDMGLLKLDIDKRTRGQSIVIDRIDDKTTIDMMVQLALDLAS